MITTKIRLTLLALVGALALSGASSAFAAYTTPRLLVTDDRTGPTTIGFTQSASDDPSAKLTFYVPAGTTATLTQAAGTTIGTVTAAGTAGDLGGALLPLTGTVQVRAASGTYLSGTTQVPIAAAATACTGTVTHTAFWVLILQAAGQTLELPVFVDQVTAPPASAFATASIQACLPPPDVPVGTPGRATFGFKLTSTVFTVRDVFASTGSGESRWRLLATPYTPNTGRANAAGSVESQSLVSFPRTIALRKPVRLNARRGTAAYRVSGTLALPAGGTPTVRLFRGRTASALGSSSALRVSGTTFTGSLAVKQTARAQVWFLQARASVPTADLGATACQSTFGVTCLGVTRAGFTARSATVRLVVPKR
ncbi:MAG: hypothetical protein H0T61_11325 [Actinobacteria bacterium]|nr:hypothetical protein [Actinomycetota bacterium]